MMIKYILNIRKSIPEEIKRTLETVALRYQEYNYINYTIVLVSLLSNLSYEEMIEIYDTNKVNTLLSKIEIITHLNDMICDIDGEWDDGVFDIYSKREKKMYVQSLEELLNIAGSTWKSAAIREW